MKRALSGVAGHGSTSALFGGLTSELAIGRACTKTNSATKRSHRGLRIQAPFVAFLARRGTDPAPREPLRQQSVRDAPDIPRQTKRLQQQDDIAGEVDLPPAQTVDGRSGKGVVIIVPPLA